VCVCVWDLLEKFSGTYHNGEKMARNGEQAFAVLPEQIVP